MSTRKRNHLGSYNVYWYGPPRHESHKKAGGLDLLSLYISAALKKAKHVTEPAAHEIMIGFQDGDAAFELFQRHPKTVWLKWERDYRDLEALPLGADNVTVGEFSIQIAQDLLEKVRQNPKVIGDFPFEVVEQAIADFRDAGYSFKSKLGPKKMFDASPLVARFFNSGNCLETQTTMVIYLGKTELHRQIVMQFGPGRWDLSRYTGMFDLYDNQIKFFSMDFLNPPPVINYADLPEDVRVHLPSNEQLHAEWGTPRISHFRS